MSDSEETLRQLAAYDGEDDEPSPTAETLAAYRAGELATEERRAVERTLARSADGRRRLAELAGLSQTVPSPELRERILASAPRRRRRSFVATIAALAAVLLTAIGLLYWLRGHQGGSLPSGVTYQIASAEGLAVVRSGAAAGDVLTAYPDTEVRLTVAPEGDTVDGLEFGLYRLTDGELQRLRDGVHLESRRGTAVFTALAADLVGVAPGQFQLLVVVGWEGRLVPSGTALDAVTSRPDTWQVLRQDVELRPFP